MHATTPKPIRRLRWVSGIVARATGSVAGVADPFGTLRLYRISLIRDLLKESGDAPIAKGEGWAANFDLLRRAAPLARRMETVESEPRYDVRNRETRIKPWADGLAIFRAPRSPKSKVPT